jgi:ribosomal protein L29
MADVTVEFGATDTGLEKTLKAVQDELTQLKGKVSSGELSMTELESTMKRIGQVTTMEKNIKAIGDSSTATSPKVEELGKDMKTAGDKAEAAGDKGSIGFGKIGIAAGIAGAAAKVGSMAIEAAFDAARKVAEGFGQAIDLGGRLTDLSDRTGETAGKLLILEKAFTNTGVSSDAVGTSLNKMQKFMVDAAQGGQAQTEALNRLGITMSELAGKTPTEQMAVFAQRIAGIQDPAQRAEAAMSIFGKSGGELIPILQNFSGELETASAQLGSMPGVMDRSAKAFDELGENMQTINSKVMQFAAGFLEGALPALNKFTSALSGVDAAGWGQATMDIITRIADRFIGAFQDPLAVIAAYGTSFEVAVKTFGNAFFNTSSTVIDFLVKSMETNLASAVTAYIGSALTDSALTFARHITEALMTFSAAIAELPGFQAAGDKMFSILDAANTKLGEAQIANMGETAKAAAKVTAEFDKTASKTRVFKEDFFGAEEATKRMNEEMNAIEASGKETRENFLGAEGSSSDAASNIQNAANNSQVTAINFGSVNKSAIGASSSMQASDKASTSIAKSWVKVAGSAYEAEKSTYGAQEAMTKAMRAMSNADMNNLFKQAKQDLKDMGGDMEAVGKSARNIPQLAEALGIEAAGKSSKQLMYEIGQEIEKIRKTPIEINIKFNPKLFAAGIESLRTQTNDVFSQVPLVLNAAPSIAEQAIAASDEFTKPIPLNLEGYESIADTRKAAEDNFANPIPLTMSGDSSANEVLGVVQDRLSTVIPLGLDADNSISQAFQSAENTFAKPIPTTIDTTLDAEKSVKGLRDSLKDGIELDVAAKSGATGLLEMIKTAVEAIKTAVEKIEPKLPTAALI